MNQPVVKPNKRKRRRKKKTSFLKFFDFKEVSFCTKNENKKKFEEGITINETGTTPPFKLSMLKVEANVLHRFLPEYCVLFPEDKLENGYSKRLKFDRVDFYEQAHTKNHHWVTEEEEEQQQEELTPDSTDLSFFSLYANFPRLDFQYFFYRLEIFESRNYETIQQLIRTVKIPREFVMENSRDKSTTEYFNFFEVLISLLERYNIREKDDLICISYSVLRKLKYSNFIF